MSKTSFTLVLFLLLLFTDKRPTSILSSRRKLHIWWNSGTNINCYDGNNSSDSMLLHYINILLELYTETVCRNGWNRDTLRVLQLSLYKLCNLLNVTSVYMTGLWYENHAAISCQRPQIVTAIYLDISCASGSSQNLISLSRDMHVPLPAIAVVLQKQNSKPCSGIWYENGNGRMLLRTASKPSLWKL